MRKTNESGQKIDSKIRLYVYRFILKKQLAPKVAEIARDFSCDVKLVRKALARLSVSHAFMLQENGELWRVAPFSAVATGFPVRAGKRSWFANCIWDALGIPALLGQDAVIQASCGCCNYEMPIEVKRGKLLPGRGVIQFSVPARDWYRDVVFT
jgi:hypothetical protein